MRVFGNGKNNAAGALDVGTFENKKKPRFTLDLIENDGEITDEDSAEEPKVRKEKTSRDARQKAPSRKRILASSRSISSAEEEAEEEEEEELENDTDDGSDEGAQSFQRPSDRFGSSKKQRLRYDDDDEAATPSTDIYASTSRTRVSRTEKRIRDRNATDDVAEHGFSKAERSRENVRDRRSAMVYGEKGNRGSAHDSRLEKVRVTSVRDYENSPPSTSSQLSSAVAQSTQSIANVWESISRNWHNSIDRRREMKDRFHRQRKMTALLAECDNVYDTYAYTCWSMLTRLDANSCVVHFKIPDKKISKLKDMLTCVFSTLHAMYTFCKEAGIEARFTLPDESTTTRTTTTKSNRTRSSVEQQRAANDDVNVDNEEEETKEIDGEQRRDDNVCSELLSDPRLLDSRMIESVMDVDECLHVLCRLATLRTKDERALRDLENVNNFASINHVMNEEHLNYLCSRIDYTGEYSPKKSSAMLTTTSKHELRHTLRGMFLVALEETQRGNVDQQFQSWSDCNRNLQKVVSRFVNRDLFDKSSATIEQTSSESMRVYMNISMKKNTQHFQLLQPPPGSSSSSNNSGGGGTSFPSNNAGRNHIQSPLLALVQLAFASYEPKRNITAVKAYVVCTMSASNESL